MINYTYKEIRRLKARAAKHLGNFNHKKDLLASYGYCFDTNRPKKGEQHFDIVQQACSERTNALKILESIGADISDVKPRRKGKHSKLKIKRTRGRVKPSVQRTTKSNVEWLPRDEWEKQTERFYNSLEWKELRYEVLRENAGSCVCCGARASDGVRIHVDHIKPRSKYPELQLDKGNLQVLCEDCNFGKSNYYADDWRVKMEN